MPDIRKVDAVIAAGGSLSAGVQIQGQVLGMFVPTATSAAITFQASPDGVTYYDVFNNAATAAEVTISASTHNKWYMLMANVHSPFWVNFIKVRSGTTGSAVTQSGGLTVTLLVQTLGSAP